MDSLQFQQKLIGIQDRLMNFALKTNSKQRGCSGSFTRHNAESVKQSGKIYRQC